SPLHLPSLTQRPPPPQIHPSSPTRRSSDLIAVEHDRDHREGDVFRHRPAPSPELCDILLEDLPAAVRDLESPLRRIDALPEPPRSEEHTSELQSLTNLVCRLLLEKKKDDDT